MSLLATQVERMTVTLLEKLPRRIVDNDEFARTSLRPQERSALISDGVTRLQTPSRPRPYSFTRKPAPGRDELSMMIATWDLSPSEHSQEKGLNVWITSWFYRPGLIGILPPAPRSFLSIHAINRIAARVPRYTALDVYKLAFAFANLADIVGRRKQGQGSYRLPVGQCLAYSDLLVTDSEDQRKYGMCSPWLDVRTVKPTSDNAEIAQARACVAALGGSTAEIPYIPRRGDSYTLGQIYGKLVN